MEFQYTAKTTPSAVTFRFEERGVKHEYAVLAEDVQDALLKMTDPNWLGELTLRLKTPVACTGTFSGATMQHIVLEVQGRSARFTYFTDSMVTRTFSRNQLVRCMRGLIKELNKEAR
ncbi:hypothetical protein STRATTON_73 [Erwinia phage vB_EamM_Stratton]|uniref:Uncharacterized protein n=2 Tax=Erskinevirus EaH2 TaxID=2169883 RepID=A0A1B2IGV7_9CAUD|nr:hypothetical protein G173_gp241 [Erwinia phage phiEaH2]AFQ96786.1 hypothetical protein [Erwinia phage phiEaH2]ANZ50498.1 hypothetical protein STRATTON_73 [Erwinia phage vB_EamM_Stratton]